MLLYVVLFYILHKIVCLIYYIRGEVMRILLVEDDKQLCQDFVNYINALDEVSLVGVTNNSNKAIEIIEDTNPDAIILDLELHNGSGNGLFVLQGLKELSLLQPPFVLVSTNNSSATTLDSARKLGADFIISKHQTDYSVKQVIDFLLMMKTVLPKIQSCTNNTTANLDLPEQKSKRLARRISTELNSIGISPKVLGYKYLLDAIQITLKEPVHNISTIIGNKYNKAEASVERAMQNAIQRAWRNSDINDLLTNYTAKISSDKGVPTVTEFIFYYANKLKD